MARLKFAKGSNREASMTTSLPLSAWLLRHRGVEELADSSGDRHADTASDKDSQRWNKELGASCLCSNRAGNDEANDGEAND
jgi:hypothetical protein